MRIALGVDQLGIDPYLVSRPADAAFQHIANTEFAADLPGVNRFAFVGEGAVARDYECTRDVRQIGRQILGETVGSVRARAIAPWLRKAWVGYRAASRGGRTKMRCLECGSEAVTERAERTAQGYCRFRCRACAKQFNERSGTLLNRTQYPSDVIALVVLWRLRYKLS